MVSFCTTGVEKFVFAIVFVSCTSGAYTMTSTLGSHQIAPSGLPETWVCVERSVPLGSVCSLVTL